MGWIRGEGLAMPQGLQPENRGRGSRIGGSPPTRKSGERCKLSQKGLGRSLGHPTVFCALVFPARYRIICSRSSA